MVIDKINCALIDPQWGWGSVNIEGNNILFLSLEHPVHGIIHSLVPREVVKQIVEGLSDLLTKDK